MTTEHLTPLTWQKSSYSGNQGGACIEAATDDEAVRIRDSKDPAGPQISISGRTWTAFLSYAAGQSV
ncbi:DUF397 domain-containing protein [Streptomyces noursei]|uniref:DUF397 domain-containing protein n=1 Tax=Streptomyces noursei TaxID=1971 RepID=A0A2N8PR27_STRNR|nr:DUF397 domain-containing protein [Streptomyces noursei]PNE43473.1 hypothetical protein AOB60_00680 [Streptomyces noursei]